MRTLATASGGLAVTVAILLVCGFLVSKIPVTNAAEGNLADTSNAALSEGVATSSGVQVAISNVKVASGKLMIFVFDDESAFDSYDYYGAAAYAEAAADSDTLQVSFPDLGAGRYAVSLFHDENSDGDFNMRGLYPLEGYGTSGARSQYDEPSFQDASTSLRTIAVRMYYP